MSADRPAIKVPPSQIWREFRMRVLPALVFMGTLGIAYLLWERTVIGPTMVGEVEPVQATVVSADAGILTNLLVRPFQLVRAGDPVAELIITDARKLSSQVQDLRSRIAISQLEINSATDQMRMAFDYQSLSMATLRYRADLAAARAELPTLESGAARAQEGWDAKVVPYNDYELAIRMRDSVRARVKELESLVTEAEKRLAQAGASASAFTNLTAETISPDTVKRLASDRREAETIRGEPIILRSPIDGTVSAILRRAGENVLAGDIILTIHALEAQRIISYLRPGSPIDPQKGLPVTVRCRSYRREEAVGQIEEISHHYAPITNMSLLRPGVLYEIGRPFAVGMPESLRQILKPGEVVDISIEQ